MILMFSQVRAVFCFNLLGSVFTAAMQIIKGLNQLLEWRDKPSVIRCDNDPEFIGHDFVSWCQKRNIRIEHIQPGNLQ